MPLKLLPVNWTFVEELSSLDRSESTLDLLGAFSHSVF